MSSTQNLLLITTALSVVMLFVLSSLARSAVDGIREWSVANGLAIVALILFAARGAIHDVLSIELANTLLMWASCMMYAGFLRHVGRAVPVRAMALAVAAAMAVLVFFHYGVDLFSRRVVVASLFQSGMTLAMATAVWRGMPPGRKRYAYLFTVGAALTLSLGYAIRAVVYALDAGGQMPFYSPHTWNVVFLSLGSLALPGLTLGAVMMANDLIITRTRYAADHDYLTGAWSRRAFFSLAGAEHARTLRSGGPLSLLVFDVDHFKAINDRHGHAVGDKVLVDIARATAATIRQVDSCARIGGEEFAVLLPQADEVTARGVAERLRSALQRSMQATAGVRVDYTVSIGVATLAQGETVEALLSRADAALYAAKEAGRNAAVCAARCVGCPVDGLGGCARAPTVSLP